MKKQEIIDEIEGKISKYLLWHIGQTHYPDSRKYEHMKEGKTITYWKHWETDSLSDAQDIESYFINKGMKEGTGGDLHSRETVYVYIF